MFLGCQKIDYYAKHCNVEPKEKWILPSLERPVHVVAERELNYPKLRMEEEELSIRGIGFIAFIAEHVQML